MSVGAPVDVGSVAGQRLDVDAFLGLAARNEVHYRAFLAVLVALEPLLLGQFVVDLNVDHVVGRQKVEGRAGVLSEQRTAVDVGPLDRFAHEADFSFLELHAGQAPDDLKRLVAGQHADVLRMVDDRVSAFAHQRAPSLHDDLAQADRNLSEKNSIYPVRSGCRAYVSGRAAIAEVADAEADRRVAHAFESEGSPAVGYSQQRIARGHQQYGRSDERAAAGRVGDDSLQRTDGRTAL